MSFSLGQSGLKREFYQNVDYLGYKNHRLLAVMATFGTCRIMRAYGPSSVGGPLAEEQKRMCQEHVSIAVTLGSDRHVHKNKIKTALAVFDKQV